MSKRVHGHIHWLVSIFLAACGGGGGGSGSDAPASPGTSGTAPDTTLTSTPPARAATGIANFTATSTESGSTFEYSLDGGDYRSTAATFGLANLEDGVHTIRVRARGTDGNVDTSPATFTWTVDTTAPIVVLVDRPPAYSNSTSAQFTFTTEANAIFQVSLDNAAFVTTTSPYQLTGLTNGSHTLRVRAVDAAGNTSLNVASYQWQVDYAADFVRIVFPPSQAYTDASQLQIRGTAQDADGIASLTVNGVAATSSNGFATWSALVPVSSGNNTFSVSVTDAVGNVRANAASVAVRNQGTVAWRVRDMSVDTVNDRLLVSDESQLALLALRRSDGVASVLSGPTEGAGPALTQTFNTAIDPVAANNRAIVVSQSDEIFAVDLTTGNRTLLVAAGGTAGQTRLGGRFSYDSAGNRVFALTPPSDSTPAMIFAVDLATGTRTVLTGGATGSGPAFVQPVDIWFDSSGVARPPQLIILDESARAVLAVEIATGTRRIVSDSTHGSGNGLIRPTRMTYDPRTDEMLLVDQPSVYLPRIKTVDLQTGDRGWTYQSESLEYASGIALDLSMAVPRVYFSTWHPAGIRKIDSQGASLFERFSDSLTGTGPHISTDSLLLDHSQPSGPSLITMRQNNAGLVRHDLLGGNRTWMTSGPGPVMRMPRHLLFDTRNSDFPSLLVMIEQEDATARIVYVGLADGGRIYVRETTAIPLNTAQPLLDSPGDRFIVSSFENDVSRIIPVSVFLGEAGPAIADSSVGSPSFGRILALGVETNANREHTRYILLDDEPKLLVMTPGGQREVLGSNTPSIGSGTVLPRADSVWVDSTSRRAFVASSECRCLQRIDLESRVRTVLSGIDVSNSQMIGRGPSLISSGPLRLAVDLENGLAYIGTNLDAIVTVDLETGDRVITSR